MAKITGLENSKDLSPKVLQMYRAVLELVEEGEDITKLRVSTITTRAGIGKGTAYEYFDSRDEIVACALINHMQEVFDGLDQVFTTMDCFDKKLDFLLDQIDKQGGKKHCFLRFVHFFTDNSEFSEILREKSKAQELIKYRPITFFSNVLKQAVECGELRDDLPIEYMVLFLFSQLITYMLAAASEKVTGLDYKKMRVYVRSGIINELYPKNK